MMLAITKGDTGEGVVEELREFIGPPDVDQAKQDAPERYALGYIILPQADGCVDFLHIPVHFI